MDNSGNWPENSYVIVIGRQFGSGGRLIGRKLAGHLGIDYYDSEILEAAARSEGLSRKIFERHDERRPSILKTLLQGAYGIPDNFHTIPLSGERLYEIQSKTIQKLSEKGSCVIVGRNADFILRHHPRLISVFLHAPLEYRAERICNRKEAESLPEALELAKERDRMRESYYNFYTGEKKWGLAQNYDLSLDTSKLSPETIVSIIDSCRCEVCRSTSCGEESPGNTGHHAF